MRPDKHTIITGIAAAAIAIVVLYGVASAYGAGQLEYRWAGPGEFSLFAMSNHGAVEFCNTVPFWIEVQSYDITPHLDGNKLGTFSLPPIQLGPGSSATYTGTFRSDEIVSSQHVFMGADFGLDGGESGVDPSRFAIIVQAQTSIIGFIPYTTTAQLGLEDFVGMMGASNLSCG